MKKTKLQTKKIKSIKFNLVKAMYALQCFNYGNG